MSERLDNTWRLPAAVAMLAIAAHTIGSATAGPIEGYGAVTLGADSCPTGATDYVVTSLLDDGSPGTLRDALHVGTWDQPSRDAKSCRRVRFAVGGTITLTAGIRMRSNYVTIDGCSAPAPGVTVTQALGPYPGITIQGNRGQVHDIIIQCVRFDGVHDEPGHNQHVVGDAILSIDADCADVPAADQCLGSWSASSTDGGVKNLVLDHVVLATTRDKLTLWGKMSDVTISNSFFYRSPLAFLISYYAGPYDLERRNISVHHNIFTENNERNPQLRGWIDNLDIRNNIVHAYDHFDDDTMDTGAVPGDGYGIRIKNNSGEQSINANLVNNVFYDDGRNGTAARALIYGDSPGVDANENGPSACLAQGDVFTAGAMGELWVAGNDFPSTACDIYSTISSERPAAAVTTHETSELCARLTAEVGLLERTPVEQAIVARIRTDLGCVGPGVSLYRGVVASFNPGWRTAALPLTELTDDETDPFPLSVTPPNTTTDLLPPGDALTVYRMLGPSMADQGNVLRAVDDSGAVRIQF